MKQQLYAWLARLGRLRQRLWNLLYRPFLGSAGTGAVLEKPLMLTNPHRLFLSERVRIAQGARLENILQYGGNLYEGSIHIGEGTHIEPWVHICAAAPLHIGKNVLMASRVYISDNDHQFQNRSLPVLLQPLTVNPVQIEDNVWLGENVVVLKGVTIGEGAVIGAGSVVTKNIPPYAVAAGIPAAVKRMQTPPNPQKNIKEA